MSIICEILSSVNASSTDLCRDAISYPTKAFDPTMTSFLAPAVMAISTIWILKKISWSLNPMYSDPRSPPLVPYIIPFVGSAYSIRKNPIKFVIEWTNYFKTSVFTTYVGGSCIIFVTDPFAFAHILSGRIPELSWSESKYQILRNGMRISEEGARTVANDMNEHTILDKYLMRTDNLNEIIFAFQRTLKDRLVPRLTPMNSDNSWSSKGTLDYFGRIIYLANTEILVGFPSMATDEDYELASLYDSKFNDLVRAKSDRKQTKHKKGFDAREELVKRITEIGRSKEVLSNQNKRPENLTSKLNEFYQGRLSTDDEARRQFALHWASYTNAIPTTFWLVYHLLSHKDAYTAVKEEIISIYKEKTESEKQNGKDVNKNVTDVNFNLADLDRMVKLDSVLTETIRLTTTQTSFRSRYANKDFEIALPVDGKTKSFFVKKNTWFLCCVTSLHRDEEIFKDALTFKWDRFVPGPNGETPIFTKNNRRIIRPVNPFGGGHSMCPGRRFAIAEIKTLLATILLNHDIRFVNDITPPAPAMAKKATISSSGFPEIDFQFEIRKSSV